MDNRGDKNIEKKEVIKRRMAIVYTLLGLTAAPVVFILALRPIAYLLSWSPENEVSNSSVI
ncbi:MAG: hypothetical protein JXN61_09970 [Sedimentisphaerales bacterium]|nr:hypothetical protein [Sedimentisphaerales bacterium]